MAHIKIVDIGNLQYIVVGGKYFPIIPIKVNIPYQKPLPLYKFLNKLVSRMHNTSIQELYDFINQRSKVSYSPTFALNCTDDFLPIARILKQHHSEFIQVFINSFFSRISPKGYNPDKPTYFKNIAAKKRFHQVGANAVKFENNTCAPSPFI